MAERFGGRVSGRYVGRQWATHGAQGWLRGRGLVSNLANFTLFYFSNWRTGSSDLFMESGSLGGRMGS